VLRQVGVSDRQVAVAVATGTLIRVRRGWYARPGASPDVVSAVHAGGRLTCVSALRYHGVWTVHDLRVHVRVARGVDAVRGTSRIHWSNERRSDNPVDSVEQSLELAISCVGRVEAIVALDSAIQKKKISRADAESLCRKTPHGRTLVPHLDGRAESGIETIARLRLRALRIKLQTQVSIPGIGRVDILIGDRLVLELDGRAWHDRPGDFERDRSRDRALTTAGYAVFRASYSQVMSSWPVLEQQILTLIRRREHFWPGRR
jgi:very-short-patch-repair endonuclease